LESNLITLQDDDDHDHQSTFSKIQITSLRILVSHMILHLNGTTLEMIQEGYEGVTQFYNRMKAKNKEQEEEELKPIEVLVKTMLDMLRETPTLAYPCRIVFVTFSHLLTKECFRVMFSHLYHKGNVQEDDEQEQEEESDSEEQDQMEQDDNEQEQEEEQPVKQNGGDDEEQVVDDLESNLTDDQMTRFDGAIGHLFKLRRDQKKQLTTLQKTQFDYCISICTLLEGLPFRSNRSDTVLTMLNECVAYIHDKINKPDPMIIMNRVCGMTQVIFKLERTFLNQLLDPQGNIPKKTKERDFGEYDHVDSSCG